VSPVEVFSSPKEGNTKEEYEDAFSSRPSPEGDKLRIAIADGATESSFSKLWANLLVESYTRSDVAGPEFFDQLTAGRRLWKKKTSGQPLLWYAAEKVKQGAFSAFLGVEIDNKTQKFKAISVGDCNLFQLDNGEPQMRVVVKFPFQNSSDFSMRPFLIGSKPIEDISEIKLKVMDGALRPKDMLILASDALSCWLLKRQESGKPLWKWIYRRLKTEKHFNSLIEYGRKNGLKNDDMTLVRILSQKERKR
jgi:hypothetical protein